MPTVKTGHKSMRPANGAYSQIAPTVALTDFNVIDNHNNTFTVQGVDAAGNGVDLKNNVTLVVTSSNPTVMVPERAADVNFKVIPLKPGAANIVVVLTYINGKAGPFTITIPVNVTGFLGVELIPAINGTITIA